MFQQMQAMAQKQVSHDHMLWSPLPIFTGKEGRGRDPLSLPDSQTTFLYVSVNLSL